MSKPTERKFGDWVLVSPCAGYLIRSEATLAEIVQDAFSHSNGCFQDDCQGREWYTLHTYPDEHGERDMLCHVCECEMHDGQEEYAERRAKEDTREGKNDGRVE